MDGFVEHLARHYPSFRQLQEQWQRIEKDQTQVWAEGMSTQELSDKVRSGEMPFNNSPIAVATAQHVYGSNKRSSVERDTLTKIQRGELRFNSDAELDRYLSERRQVELSGESKYTAHGFDKGLGQLRQRVLTLNSQFQNREFLEENTSILTENFKNTLDETGGDMQAALVPLRTMEFAGLPYNSRVDALRSIGTMLADSQGQLGTFLDEKLSDGRKVSALLGPANVEALHLRAERKYMELLENDSYTQLNTLEQGLAAGSIALENIPSVKEAYAEKYSNRPAAIYQFNNRVDSIVRQYQSEAVKQQSARFIEKSLNEGTFASVVDRLPVSKSDAIKIAQDYIDRRAYDEEWSADRRLGVYVQNGVPYPNDTAIKSLPSRIDNLMQHLDKNGKPIPDERTVQLYQEFELLNRNPGYAREQLGDVTYEKLSNLQACQVLLGMNETEALQFFSENMLGGKSWREVSYQDMYQKLSVIYNQIPGADSDKNAEYVLHRAVPLASMLSLRMDKEQAIRLTGAFLAKPDVTFVYKGAVYFKSDFPEPPVGRDWSLIIPRFLEQYMKERNKDPDRNFYLLRIGSNAFHIVDSLNNFPEADERGNILIVTPQQLKQYADSWGERAQPSGTIQPSASDANARIYTGYLEEELERESKREEDPFNEDHIRTFFANNWTFDTRNGQRMRAFLLSKPGREWLRENSLGGKDMEEILPIYQEQFGSIGTELKRYYKKKRGSKK